MLVGRHKEILKTPKLYLVGFTGALILLSWLLEKFGIGPKILCDSIALLAVFMVGGPIVLGSIKGILTLRFNVDELVSLAIIGALSIGEYLAAAEVALIMTIGSLLEEFTAQKSKKAIREIKKLSPENARIRRSGEDILVPIENLVPGDLIIVKPGEEIPADGVVTKGLSSVNEASITGEAGPIDKFEGDLVFAGTINLTGVLEVKTNKVGSESLLGKTIELMEKAQIEKMPIMRMADRFAQWFTPIVILLAISVYFFTGDPVRAITVLIVGCPCVFVLATPTAITAAFGNAAKHGIIIKDGAHLERASEVNAVVFDKTGTLTIGSPMVTEIMPLNCCSPDHLLLTASIAEKFSDHPIARSILEEAKKRGILIPDPEFTKIIPGKGIEAKSNGDAILVGKIDSMLKGTCPKMNKIALKCEDTGKTTLFVAKNGDVKGLICVEDAIREETAISIAYLRKMGINTFIFTGDNIQSAASVANRIGVDGFKARLLPEDKMRGIRDLQEKGQIVAIVGDGINDAPALASADVGIAMGVAGADVAIEAADIVLMKDNIAKIPVLFLLAKKTKKTIYQNIWFFGILYNFLAFILSTLGFLSPLAAAVFHNVGSVSVVINSARLINYKVSVQPLVISAQQVARD